MVVVAVLLGLLAVSFLLSGTGAFAVRRLWRRPVPASAVLPKLTVLKPLKGVEAGLYENLLSMALQDYPDFELLLGIEDPDDPAVGVAQRIRREHPNVRIKVVAGAPAVGMNPKVNNLMHMVRFAKHDLILISDSNVRVEAGYLEAVVSEMADPEVGLVHSVLVGQAGDTIGSLLENLQMNTVTAYGVAGMQLLTSHPLVIGKSMLMRRSVLEAIGGFPSVANVLAEDYVLGRAFEAAGYRVRLSPHRIGVVNSGWSLERFWNRQLRWCQMRRRLAPAAYVWEPGMCTLLWAALLVPAVLAATLAPAVRVALLALGPVALALRLVLDSAQVEFVRGSRLSARELCWMPVKELLMQTLWLIGMVSRTVEWRGNQMHIGRGSVLSPVDSFVGPAAAPKRV